MKLCIGRISYKSYRKSGELYSGSQEVEKKEALEILLASFVVGQGD